MAGPPHIAPSGSVPAIMRSVLLALIPGTLAMILIFGWGVLINVLIAVAVALPCEALMLRLRNRPMEPFLQDGSAVVTAVLLALALPPLTPWWMPAVGVALALVLGKHLYGGLGFNPFNPAMVGYAALLVSFPGQMTVWLPPTIGPSGSLGLMDSLHYALSGSLRGGLELDALTQATPLDQIRTGLGLELTVGEIRTEPGFGLLAGAGWQWVNLLFLAGGAWLMHRRVIAWQIPMGVLLGLAVPALVFWTANPDQYAPPLLHLLSGGAMLAAFFIATDPVSAATTPRGRFCFGVGIGVLTWVIRTWGGYPDGIAFGVLLMNMAVPLIDRYTRPRIHGRGKPGPGTGERS
ncbi:MAG: electron transport complex subunit RsxD [Ectothiorhodospiraceae bacterium]|nr:electron transport complex subunit RsxD [Ectothiorhodospiraceae bacterium]